MLDSGCSVTAAASGGAAGIGIGAGAGPGAAGVVGRAAAAGGAAAAASVPVRIAPLDVGLDDPAVRAAALEPAEVDPGLLGHPPGERAREDRAHPDRRRCRDFAIGVRSGGGIGDRRWRRRRGGCCWRCGSRGRLWRRARGASSAAASSPSSSSSAIGVLTATPSVPSPIRILPSRPSSTASISIVALSVSISASTSPGLTASPSRLSQRARLPSVIVGDSAGIRISIGMTPPVVLVLVAAQA